MTSHRASHKKWLEVLVLVMDTETFLTFMDQEMKNFVIFTMKRQVIIFLENSFKKCIFRHDVEKNQAKNMKSRFLFHSLVISLMTQTCKSIILVRISVWTLFVWVVLVLHFQKNTKVQKISLGAVNIQSDPCPMVIIENLKLVKED